MHYDIDLRKGDHGYLRDKDGNHISYAVAANIKTGDVLIWKADENGQKIGELEETKHPAPLIFDSYHQSLSPQSDWMWKRG